MNRINQSYFPRHQHGASFFPTLIIVVLIGMMLVAVLKVAPSYMDNSVIMSSLEGVKNNNDMRTTTVGQVRAQVMRTLLVNGIEFDSDSITYVSEGGVNYIDVNYESRVPIFYNIDAVVTFQNRVERVP